MILNLKTFGLLLAAVATMSAVVSSASQASQYTCSSYRCLATGSNSPGNETLTTPGGTVQCKSHYLVEEEGTTNGAGIQSPGASTVTVTPTYTGCSSFGFLNASISMNGCDYVFHAKARLATGQYNNEVTIACPAGKSITITSGTCVADVSAQGPLKSIETENLASGKLTVRPNITGITMNVTTDGFGCPFPSAGHFNASFHGDVTFEKIGGGSISVSGI
jgi:hypothetical protein